MWEPHSQEDRFMNVDPDEDEENKINNIVVIYKGNGGSNINYPPAKKKRVDSGLTVEIKFHPGSKQERKNPNIKKNQEKVAAAAAKRAKDVVSEGAFTVN